MATTKTIDYKTASQLELARKLKALASQKTHAKQAQDDEKVRRIEKEYAVVKAIKDERFPSKRQKSYMTYTDDDIQKADLETTKKALASVRSTICVYPHREKELAQLRDKLMDHRDKLQAMADIKKNQAILDK